MTNTPALLLLSAVSWFLPVKTQVTPDQIAAYRNDGFLAYPGFLSKDEVAELKSAVLTAIEQMGKKKVADPSNTSESSDSYTVFTQKLNLWRISDTVKRYMLSPELGKLMCALGGVEGYRVWHDQALIKEPYGNPTAWHLDNPYWSFHSQQSISVWIALEDATLENGCMWFVPESQKKARYDNVGITHNLADLFRIYPEMTDRDPIPVPMKAGDCSFHNGLTAHGAGANMTRGRRIAMTCAYMPLGSTFNGKANILPPAYIETLSQGDLLENDDWNPIVFGQDVMASA